MGDPLSGARHGHLPTTIDARSGHGSRHRSRGRSRPDTRGSATVEALVALPFFALILSALIFVGNRARDRQVMADDVRACAFLYAARGCSDPASLPPNCQALIRPGLDAGDASDTGDAREVDLGPHVAADSLAVVADLPILGDVVTSLLGQPVRVASGEEHARPAMLGGGALTVQVHEDVLCSSVPRHADPAETLFRELTGL